MFFLLFILHLHFLSTFFHLALVPFIFVSFRYFFRLSLFRLIILLLPFLQCSFFLSFLSMCYGHQCYSFQCPFCSFYPLHFLSISSLPSLPSCSPSSLVLPAWLSAFISCYLQSWPKFLGRPRINSRASRYISLLTQVRKFSVPPSPLSNV